jgi:hypothetical protein
MNRTIAALLLGASPTALFAQASGTPAPPPAPAQPPRTAPAPQSPPRQAPPAAEDEEDENAITVTGSRRALPGSVIVDIAPEVTLGPTDVRSYGVNSVSQLLSELAPQTGSGRGGAPVVLLNGRRISSPREIADVPTEAIQRVEILPEEVALSYGYPADQKVVNIVLRRRFRSITAEGSAGISTAGGGESGSADLNLLRIRGPARLNLDVRYQRSASLLESQRDIIPSPPRLPFDFAGNVTGAGGPGTEIDPALSALAGETVTVAGVPDFAGPAPVLADFAGTANVANVSDISRYRTLRPATDQLAINAVYARPVFGDFTATLNASLQANGSESLSGPPGVSLLLPAANPYSPFGTDVALHRYVAEEGLRQGVAGETGHAGVTLNGDHAGWHWNFTANYDRVESRTSTERGVDPFPVQSRVAAGDPSLDPFGTIPAFLFGPRLVDRARSLSNSGNVQAIANGDLFDLPAGALAATFKLGAAALGFDTESTRAGLTSRADLSREDGNGQVTLNLPITSRRRHFGAAIGDLSANFNFAAHSLSDFGTVTTLGYGMTWRPRDGITLLWSMSDEHGAPTVQQLGNPDVLTPNVPVFDYVNGETVLVTRRDGGNPDLSEDRRRVLSIGFNATVLREPQLNFTANYVRARTDNAISSLPGVTADIQAAFPDRFLRDADGDLVAFDNRPVNFARERREQLRWGVNLSVPLRASAAQRARLLAAFQAAGGVEALRRQFGDRGGGEGRRRGGRAEGTAPPGGAASPPEGSAPPAAGGQPGPGGFNPFAGGGGRGGGGFGGRGGRGGFGGPGGPGAGRLQFAFYHTWVFQDDILIRPGVPLLDQLDGAAAGSTGGQPRHRIEAQAGFMKNGLGARLSANWQSGTTVRGGTGTAPNDLFFSDLATVNLRLFADLAQVGSLGLHSWARGLRVSLSVNNLFDSRQRVRDAAGNTPLSYQPDYLDPQGRAVLLTVRKLFF